MKVCWPIAGAVHGVAGARIASTSLNSASTCSRYQRRNFCALTTSEDGIMAPAIRRSRTAGSKSLARAAQPIEMQCRAFGRGDDISCGAGALHFRQFDFARDIQCLRDLLDRLQRFRIGLLAEIAARDRDPQAVECRAKVAAAKARPAGRRSPRRPDRNPASRHRRARDRACSARTVRDDRSSRRTESCARATAGHRSASVRKCRRTRTAPGSSHWCRSRAPAARARRRPRRPSRRTSRRSCASRHADCARVRHGRSRR